MSEIMVANGIVIDDVEGIVEGITSISGKQLSGIETILKFINTEKNTKFYIDNKCVCRMQPDRNTVYLWLDSGYTDCYGNPIFLSLLNHDGEYKGHFYGTTYTLAGCIRSFFPKNIRDINKNLDAFRGKYETKASARAHAHIMNEQQYLTSAANDTPDKTTMGELLAQITIDVEEPLPEPAPETIEEQETPAYDLNFHEKEITIGLLLDTIDGMQGYIDELLAEIEKFNSVDRVRMKELEAKNEEYKRALVQVRSFVEEEQNAKADESSQEANGHNLLGRNGRILVLGATALDVNTMSGIAKMYGFEKKDFEYETDYTKVVNISGRIKNAERYSAIIFGACPHKVAGLGDWSSIIEKFRQSEGLPCAYDARSHSGELKVTKESFRMALWNVCNELREKSAC